MFSVLDVNCSRVWLRAGVVGLCQRESVPFLRCGSKYECRGVLQPLCNEQPHLVFTEQ